MRLLLNSWGITCGLLVKCQKQQRKASAQLRSFLSENECVSRASHWDHGLFLPQWSVLENTVSKDSHLSHLESRNIGFVGDQRFCYRSPDVIFNVPTCYLWFSIKLLSRMLLEVCLIKVGFCNIRGPCSLLSCGSGTKPSSQLLSCPISIRWGMLFSCSASVFQ